MVVGGLDFAHKLGFTRGDLFPVTTGIRAANSERLKLIGAMLITISAVGADGNTRSGSHMCYISENVTRLFLSKKACCDLGIIPENFSEIGAADSQASVNKCEVVDTSKPDRCGCPRRVRTPDPPAELPCPATEENIKKVKEFITKYYGDSAFNCCEQQPLPLMRDSPPMRLFADAEARPVAYHKPFPIPLHWQEAVKQHEQQRMQERQH